MADDSIQWTLANPSGILRDEAEDAWHSGHVTDIMKLESGGLLIATQTGGVWLINENNSTLSISHDWLVTDINCLAKGPDDFNHVFAGCTKGIIRETDIGETIPLLNWKEINDPLPLDAGDVMDICIIPRLRRIIVACSNGLFWSVIPVSSPKKGCFSIGSKPPPRLYKWKQAKINGGGKHTQGFWNVAIGSDKSGSDRSELEDIKNITIVAGGYYIDYSTLPGDPSQGGLFIGQWDTSGELVMKRPAFNLDDKIEPASFFLSGAGTCSVCSFKMSPNILYAGYSGKDGRLFKVLRSKDGGFTWTISGTLVTKQGDDLNSLAGSQGVNWNNCISVSPTDQGYVVLGWVDLFLSLDSGKTWRLIKDSKHQHTDHHALAFYPEVISDFHDLYVGSDGGVLRINLDDYGNGTGSPFQSNYNQFLPTIQCYSRKMIQFFGTLGVSRTSFGLISTGLQDNENVWCTSTAPVASSWLAMDGGDGGWNSFTQDGALLHYTKDGPAAISTFSNSAGVNSVSSTKVPLIKTSSTPLYAPAGEYVVHPTYKNKPGHTLQSVATVKNLIFGLYADQDTDEGYYWELIATIPDNEILSEVASFAGDSIFAGTENGKMYFVDTKAGSVVPITIKLPKLGPFDQITGGSISRIVTFSDTDVFASINNAFVIDKNTKQPTAYRYHYLIRLDGSMFVTTPGNGLPNEVIYALEAVTHPHSETDHTLFLATSERVYISRDSGKNWQEASDGLPRNAHCSDLRFVNLEPEARLYLSTYGWSVWVATLK